MTYTDILRQRLVNQQIVGGKFIGTRDLVKYMVVMQAQNFDMAMWSIGLRLPHLACKHIEKAFDDGLILRTHIMRTACHIIASTDIRWMLTLTAPGVHMNNNFSYRKFELDTDTLNRSKDIMVKALEGGRNMTRLELMIYLSKQGIKVNRLRFSYIMMHAELEQIVCSGPRRNRQFTYALLDERVSEMPGMNRNESLAELAKRYFISHGPATIRDFCWWSGLSGKDAEAGINMSNIEFTREKIGDREYIFVPENLSNFDEQRATFLMPDYDEYVISYKNREFIYHSGFIDENLSLYNHATVVDGLVVGTWKAVENKKQMDIKTTIYCPLDSCQTKAFSDAVNRYRCFVEPE